MDAKQFIPVRMSTLRGDDPIPFDIYVLVAGRHILYCRSGDQFEGERINRLKQKKLVNVYIDQTFETQYRQYTLKNVRDAYLNSTEKPLPHRARVIHGAQQAAAEDLIEFPDSSAFFTVARESAQKFVGFVLKEQQSLKELFSLENVGPSPSHHGVSVAALALGVAEEIGISELDRLEQLTMGCLIHDSEHHHSELDMSVQFESRSPEEQEKFRAHPEQAYQRLKETNLFPPLVLDIVRGHEESIDGSGFPRGIKEKDADPLVWVASTANTFDQLVSFQGQSPKEALKNLYIAKTGLLPVEHLEALKAMIRKKGIL